MSVETTKPLIAFLDEIGLLLQEGSVSEDSTLPGVEMKDGAIIVDHGSLKWPGDLLYAGGLLATLAPSERAIFQSTKDLDPAHEMASMAWAYAAAMHLEIDPLEVFHEGGYQSGGAQLVQQLQAPQPFGAPMLLWYQMTTEFPKMKQWLRAVEDPSAIPTPH